MPSGGGKSVDCHYSIGLMAKQLFNGAFSVRDQTAIPGATLVPEALWATLCSGAGTNMLSCFLQAPPAGFQPNIPSILGVTLSVPLDAITDPSCQVPNTASMAATSPTGPLGPYKAPPVTDTAVGCPAGKKSGPPSATMSNTICLPGYHPNPAGKGCVKDSVFTGPKPSAPNPGTSGARKKTVTPTCPPGTTGTPPHCQSAAATCPPGTIGVPPLCVTLQGPSGLGGNNPGAAQPKHNAPAPTACPQGQFGTPPNCHALLKKFTPPPSCGAGMTGTPPNCHPVLH